MARIALLLLCAVAALTAGAAEPSVELSAQPAQVAVGDPLVLTITYRWPAGWRAAEPDPAAALAGVYVTAAPPPERASTAEEERRTFRFTVAATRSGAWLLPQPSFTASGPGGERTVQAPEVVVQVGTEAAPAHLPAARPLLVRPPAALAASGRAWWLAGGAAVVLMLGLGLWFLRRRVTAPPPSPWAVFARALPAARQAGEGKEAGARLSLALRRCVGAVWAFDGAGLTPREIAAVLRGLPEGAVQADEAQALVRLLERLDELRWSAGDLPMDGVLPIIEEAATWGERVRARLAAAAARKQEAA